MPAETLPQLPHYVEAERSVLGAILVNNQSFVKVLEKGLLDKDFFLPQHQKVFQGMLRLDEAHQPIDLVTITDDLKRNGDLEASGGAAYLSSLVDGIPNVLNVDHYARLIKEKAILRDLIRAAEVIQQRALEASQGVDQILDGAESEIFRIADERIRAGFVGISQLVRDNFDRLEKVFTEGRRITGLETGYLKLDSLTSGLQPSELIIIAARPSIGKTAFALNVAENVAISNGQPVAVFSLEMSKEALLTRLLASQARIDMHKFRTGHLSRDDWRRMTEALGRMGEAPLWIDDSGASTVLEMSAKARRLKKDRGLALVVIDYMQLIAAYGRFNSRQEEVSSISRGLKAMAKELKVPVVVLSQLTRAPEREDRKPQLSDLRESGAIEQDADVVMFINRPKAYAVDVEPEERAKSELIIAKQRNGPTDKLNFVFLNSFTRFEQGPDNWDNEETPA